MAKFFRKAKKGEDDSQMENMGELESYEASVDEKNDKKSDKKRDTANFFRDKDQEFINGKRVHVIRVAGATAVNPLAGSIVAAVEEGSLVDLRAVGANSLNQLIKGAIVARGILAKNGMEVLLRPGFTTMKDADEVKTCLTVKVIIQ